MRAPIEFSWQGLVWAGKLFAEGENDSQFPAVKLPGRRAAKTHSQAKTHAGTSRKNRMERGTQRLKSAMLRDGTQTKNMKENTPSLWK